MVIFFSASIYHANTVLVQQAALKVGIWRFDEMCEGNVVVWKTIVVIDTSDDDIDHLIDFICLFISRRKNLEWINFSSSIVFRLESLDTSLDTLFNILYR